MHYPGYIGRWEKDLQSRITDGQKDKIMQLAHVSSIPSKMEEVNYKLLIHWYYTPNKLHAMSSLASLLCWDCGGTAMHGHIWSTYPLIQGYWNAVFDIISIIQKDEIKPEPWSMLFHWSTVSTGRYRSSITPYLLNAAKSLIPLKTHCPHCSSIPTKSRWFFFLRRANMYG